MKNDWLYEDFKKWLRSNLSSFIVHPEIANITDDSFEIIFKNVEDIKLTLCHDGLEIWSGESVGNKKNLIAEDIDLITEFPVSEFKDSKGYYCDQCLTRQYFKTRHELWEDHVYKPFLEWVNENLRFEKYVCIYQPKKLGSFWIKIQTNEELEKDSEAADRVYAKPIIKRPL